MRDGGGILMTRSDWEALVEEELEADEVVPRAKLLSYHSTGYWLEDSEGGEICSLDAGLLAAIFHFCIDREIVELDVDHYGRVVVSNKKDSK